MAPCSTGCSWFQTLRGTCFR